jgi:hypothetical protein
MESVFNEMAFGICGTNGINKMPQMPFVPSTKYFLVK